MNRAASSNKAVMAHHRHTKGTLLLRLVYCRELYDTNGVYNTIKGHTCNDSRHGRKESKLIVK